MNSRAEFKGETIGERRVCGGTRMTLLLLIALIACLIVWGVVALKGVTTVRELFLQNRELKEAISQLTREDQIGYAKVLRQETKGGRLYTTLAFIETARDDKLEPIFRKRYTIEGDVVHFDALIVKFDDRMVMDGKERAMYLWRRVYGEQMRPTKGFPIESEGDEPYRYRGLLDKLPVEKRALFWDAIWDLANDPAKLKEHGIEAVYGNAVYTKLRPGLIYVFKISGTGQLYPETVPDI